MPKAEAARCGSALFPFVAPILNPLASASHCHSPVSADPPSICLLTQGKQQLLWCCLLTTETSGSQLPPPDVHLLASRHWDISPRGAQNAKVPWVCHLPENLFFPISHPCTSQEAAHCRAPPGRFLWLLYPEHGFRERSKVKGEQMDGPIGRG